MTLAVRAARPAAHLGRRRPWVLALSVLAASSAAVAVAARALPDDGAARSRTAPMVISTAPSGEPVAAVTGEPTAVSSGVPGPAVTVTGLQLFDNRGSVLLRWFYPTGSAGPVLISGGQLGQPLRIFQQLSTGADQYVVYGLNDAVNYCFTVAVVTSADQIGATPPVCTAR